jgi:hypothetical protein
MVMQPCRIHGRRRDLSPRWWWYVVMVLSASMYQDRSCRTLYGTVIGYCDVNVEMAVSLTFRSIYVVISTVRLPNNKLQQTGTTGDQEQT